MALRSTLILAALAFFVFNGARAAEPVQPLAPEPEHSPAFAPITLPPEPSALRSHVPVEIRERQAELIQLPKEKLWTELLKWPAFQQMTLQEQGRFLTHLAEMRQQLHAHAMRKANELGLKIPADQEDAYVRFYLQERMAMEKKLWQETQPLRKQLDEELAQNLKKKYG